MKIAEIRKVIQSCNWSRNDLTGATKDEFNRMNVPARMIPHIEAVQALVIPPRFVDDIASAASAIAYAEKTIARWQAAQDTKCK